MIAVIVVLFIIIGYLGTVVSEFFTKVEKIDLLENIEKVNGM